jgi:hypothetical protein
MTKKEASQILYKLYRLLKSSDIKFVLSRKLHGYRIVKVWEKGMGIPVPELKVHLDRLGIRLNDLPPSKTGLKVIVEIFILISFSGEDPKKSSVTFWILKKKYSLFADFRTLTQ